MWTPLPLLLLAAPADPPPAPVGARVADFALPDPAAGGRPWVLADEARASKATVVVFLAAGCPVSNSYLPRLADLHKRFGPDGVLFVGVNSHPVDDPPAVAAHAKEHKVPFPVLKDAEGTLADRLRIDRVPAAVVLDAGRVVRYMGRIDDQFAPGVHGSKAGTRELEDAVAAVVAGREVRAPFAPPAGCKLSRDRKLPAAPAAEPVTYHKHVSRVIQEKCQGCHRPGEAGPFPLLTYKDAKGWADMIREVVAGGQMPPWHADAPRGHFRNDRRLSDDQKQTVLAWVDQGCPEGNPADAPEPARYVTGWRLGREPDLVVRMNRPIHVPAQYLFGLSGMPYQYVPAGEPFAEDTWVQAVEVRPDFRSAVHHVIVYVVPPGGKGLDGEEFARHMLATYVPGDDPAVCPEGTARLIPKGAKLLFEVHYTPNGKPGVDRSAVGLVLANKPPERVVQPDAALCGTFVIPPGAANHRVEAAMTFPRPVTLTSLTPHMHLRGKAFEYVLVANPKDPADKGEVLLRVPKYDFNWQAAYTLAAPRAVPAGARLVCTAVYDNSKANPANPDPTKTVRWGDQTWDEMMIGFVEYTVPR